MASNRKLKNRRRAETERLRQRYDYIMTAIVLAALTIAPLVFRMVRIDFVSPAITNTTTADTGTMSDVFTHYKTLIYYALSAILVVIFSVKLLTVEDMPGQRGIAEAMPTKKSMASAISAKKGIANDLSDGGGGFRLTRYDAALAALCVFLLISCFATEYRLVALNGFAYMLDGTATHICYCVLFFIGYHVISRCDLKKWLFVPLYVSGLVNALISLMNFVGVEMIDIAIIKIILGVPANAIATNANAFTSTFGNINYLSGFGGVLYAVFFARFMFSGPSFIFKTNSAQKNASNAVKQHASNAVKQFASNAVKQFASDNINQHVSGVVKQIASGTAKKPVDKPISKPIGKAVGKPISKSVVESVGKPAGDFSHATAATTRRANRNGPNRNNARSALPYNIDRIALVKNILSLFMIAAAFSIIVTSLSSSGFFTFVMITPVIIVIAMLSGEWKRKAVLAAASLAVCALVFMPLASINDLVYEETFGMFNIATNNSVGNDNNAPQTPADQAALAAAPGYAGDSPPAPVAPPPPTPPASPPRPPR
ncbi:MAG: hypothetical protein FWH01_16190, partial [Oscillospiraceae bacterium]|nr:hypothetical protein [Oscillospiraceae bacterium]